MICSVRKIITLPSGGIADIHSVSLLEIVDGGVRIHINSRNDGEVFVACKWVAFIDGPLPPEGMSEEWVLAALLSVPALSGAASV